MCSLVFEWRDLASVLNHVDFFLTLVLPFLIIVTLNSLICRTVHQLARVRRTMTIRDSRRRFLSSCPQPIRARRYTDNNIGRTYSHRANSHSQNKVTQMLLVVSTVFICLNLPSYLLRIWVYVNVSKRIQSVLIERNTAGEYCECKQFINRRNGRGQLPLV